MKRLGLGVKISLGFSLLILISGLLGMVAVWKMGGVEEKSMVLAREYVPEVEVAVELRGAANRVMYEMRGYGLTEEKSYYNRAKKELDAVETSLEKARILEQASPHLVKLRGQLDNADAAVKEYKTLVQKTVETSSRLMENRQTLDASAMKYMDNSTEFLHGQNEKFQRDLSERQEKIRLAANLVETGSQARVLNFKSQALDNLGLMRQAIETIGQVQLLLPELLKITRDPEDLERIGAVEKAANNYGAAMERFMVEYKKGALANGAKLSRFRAEMDKNAGIYVKNCDDFLQGQQEKLTTDMVERNRKITLVGDIINLGNATRIGAFKSQALRDPGIMTAALTNFPKIEAKFEDLKTITRLPEDLQRIEDVKAAGNAYKSAMTDFLDNWVVRQDLARKRDKAGRAVIEVCKITANAGMEATGRIADNTVTSLSNASTIMIVGLVMAVVVGLLVALFITRSITGPVNQIISGLNQGSGQVASASIQVSAASQSVAEGASQQAASIEETSSSMEEMASMTKQNTQNAANADSLMKEANQVVGSANASMQNLTQSMVDISKASEETSKIIKTIDEIAFQTNLLALNAAVEAARAGEAGAGFAVVADEVRNLAMRAADAAKDTAQLIEGTVKKVNEGSELVSDTNDAFGQVAESAEKVGGLISEISSASEEQSNGIEQVNNAIGEMDRVVQQNAANAEESASASEEMSAQAETLSAYVDELVILVTGRQNRRVEEIEHGTGPALAAPSSGEKPPGPKSIPAQEVRPEQLIPLDDEEDSFKNF
ncbi:MAG: methyl-accepting chemotaxis protein [Desulfobacterales bacterium]|nr:methyl-accepting chemotaxis protein [Desulfobacterales bacterium]